MYVTFQKWTCDKFSSHLLLIKRVPCLCHSPSSFFSMPVASFAIGNFSFSSFHLPLTWYTWKTALHLRTSTSVSFCIFICSLTRHSKVYDVDSASTLFPNDFNPKKGQVFVWVYTIKVYLLVSYTLLYWLCYSTVAGPSSSKHLWAKITCC